LKYFDREEAVRNMQGADEPLRAHRGTGGAPLLADVDALPRRGKYQRTPALNEISVNGFLVKLGRAEREGRVCRFEVTRRGRVRLGELVLERRSGPRP